MQARPIFVDSSMRTLDIACCGLSLALGISLPTSALGQAVAASSGDALTTLDRRTDMTKVRTARARPKTPAARAATETNDIRPFQVHVSDSALADLRRRVRATRWPEKETVTDNSQGVPLAMMQALARHWGTDYDWRKVEAKLNALPQFIAKIDGLDIH